MPGIFGIFFSRQAQLPDKEKKKENVGKKIVIWRWKSRY